MYLVLILFIFNGDEDDADGGVIGNLSFVLVDKQAGGFD